MMFYDIPVEHIWSVPKVHLLSFRKVLSPCSKRYECGFILFPCRGKDSIEEKPDLVLVNYQHI